MKVVIQWKDPDACVESVDNSRDHEAARTGNPYHLPEDILDKLKILGYSEYLVVEFDTETMTGVVQK